jgi:hypothetical protein
VKRFIGRVFWLAAWSVWLWLGFGLYRELPRELGPIARELPIASGEAVLGFIGETNLIATQAAKDQFTPAILTIFNAETGRLVNRFEGPPMNEIWCQTSDAMRHGVVFANRLSEKTGVLLLSRLHVCDLSQGTWRRVTDNRGADISVHPSRPWVVFNELPRFPTGTYRVVAVDFSNGREIFSRALPNGAPVYHNPFFVGTDRIVIPLTTGTAVPAVGERNQKATGGSLRVEARSTLARSIEIWRVGDPPTLEQTIADVALGRIVSVAGDGRFSFSEAPTVPSRGVFDLEQERNIFVHPNVDEDFDARFHRRVVHPPRLSASGKNVFGGNPPTLREVDSKRLLWRPLTPEFIAWGSGANSFQVMERWQALWKDWFPNLAIETHALRNLETGSLIYRTSTKPTRPRILPHNWNVSGSLAVANGGAVYRIPPRVNWPLLALCQTILALPLALLWAILRWRRKRRLRLAGVAP